MIVLTLSGCGWEDGPFFRTSRFLVRFWHWNHAAALRRLPRRCGPRPAYIMSGVTSSGVKTRFFGVARIGVDTCASALSKAAPSHCGFRQPPASLRDVHDEIGTADTSAIFCEGWMWRSRHRESHVSRGVQGFFKEASSVSASSERACHRLNRAGHISTRLTEGRDIVDSRMRPRSKMNSLSVACRQQKDAAGSRGTGQESRSGQVEETVSGDRSTPSRSIDDPRKSSARQIQSRDVRGRRALYERIFVAQ